MWPWICCAALVAVVLALLLRIRLLQKEADEIAAQFAQKLREETNTPISLSGADPHMRRLAAEINTQLRQLNAQRHHFLQGDSELREAMTNISHDLRTPLTAIRGYLDLLEREEKSPAVARYVQMIENRTEALIHLTQELFRYSVIASAADGAAYEEISLGSALEESIAAHYSLLTARGITPQLITPNAKVWRRLDKGALTRILENIIGNAAKYSDGDLRIVLQESGEISISNEAKGLDPVAAGRLFDRFFTLETGRNSTGLGLSIAKLLAEQMGGSISAEYLAGRLCITLRF